MSVTIRFDEAISLSNRNQDHTGFHLGDWPSVPSVGECINIGGDPFVVLDRGWAVGVGTMYCYVRLWRCTSQGALADAASVVAEACAALVMECPFCPGLASPTMAHSSRCPVAAYIEAKS